MKFGASVWTYDRHRTVASDRIQERKIVKIGTKLVHLFDGSEVVIETLAMRGWPSTRVFLSREDLDAYLRHISDFARMQNRVARLFSDDVTNEQVLAILNILGA